MRATSASSLLVLAASFLAFPAAAAEPQLVCFGNEPSWSLRFDAPGRATLAFPDGKPVEFRGKETRLDFLKTVGTDGWFVYFRLYAPLQPFFDKTFSLGDFELVEEGTS